MGQFKTILLTTDFSDTSKRAFSYAQTLAEKFDSRLVLAYVEEDKLPALVVEYTAVGLDEIMHDQQELAHTRLQEFVEQNLDTGCEVETRVAAGTPHIEIIRLAEECEADLIVMATHGRGFISHAILGSTTERVLRRAPCPVFAVRCPESGNA